MPAAGPAVDLALTPDDGVLFISVQRTDERGARYTELFPLDPRTATFNGVIRLPGFTTGPIAMHPAGTRLYAPHRNQPIMVIDTATYQISEIPGVTVGIADLYGASVSSNGRCLVLSATNDDTITLADLTPRGGCRRDRYRRAAGPPCCRAALRPRSYLRQVCGVRGRGAKWGERGRSP
jgi:DNA-binding beta-propeller fold protein YncE